jgi:CheY-like chemotaxis protein
MTFKDAHKFDREFSKGFPIILLAEDNVQLRNLFLNMLYASSFAVLVAADGQEAIELSRNFENEIALLLTDMEMPCMDGIELTELILRERPGIRILQMSGQLEESFAGRNLTTAFLNKPFGQKVLIEKILKVMDAPPGTQHLVSPSMKPIDYRMFNESAIRGLPVILLADSNVVVRNLLLRVLHPMLRTITSSSFAVLVAANGQEAIELSRSFEGEIALLLTDMELPRMDGTELTELILQERPGIRILQMSGRPEESFAGRNLTTPFLQQPFTLSVLIETIQAAMAAPLGTVLRPYGSAAPSASGAVA